MMYEKILEIVLNTTAINTHSHHRENEFFINFDLEKLLENTYVSWCGASFKNSEEARKNYMDKVNKVRFKSYFVWLQKSLKEIYGISEDLSAKNWGYYSQVINSYYQDVLSQKIEKKYFSTDDAGCIIKNVLYNNPKKIYNL